MEKEVKLFSGISQDTSPANQPEGFLWEAHNVRIVDQEEHSSLSIVNEKGTTNTNVTYQGQYVGHCVVGKYLVVFTTLTYYEDQVEYTTSFIYRTHIDEYGQYISVLLVSSPDLLIPNKLIQTLGYVENALVSKVYWTDGETQPKMIIITKPEIKGYTAENGDSFTSLWPNSKEFLFTPELELNHDITITKSYGDGYFSPGVIQYALSYYNQYEAESNIFYVSRVLPISHPDRGGNPEEMVGNVFNLNMKGLDNFDYVRVYSIHRSSLNAVPTVKIVGNVKINKYTNGDMFDYRASFSDSGTIGSLVDPTILLYKGTSLLSVGCLYQQENTLFLGNISNLSNSNPKYITLPNGSKEDIFNYLGHSKEIEETIENFTFVNTDETDYYRHASQLSENTSTFKTGEWYRLGFQFQYSNGSWTDPIFLKDYTIQEKNSLSENVDYKEGVHKSELSVVRLKYTIPGSAVRKLLEQGYRRVRGVIVYPEFKDRKVLAQGILCPTVFTMCDRYSNRPFAQSSWFFRCIPKTEIDQHINNIPLSDEKYAILEDCGATIQFRHLHPLHSTISRDYRSRGAEVYGTRHRTFKGANSDPLYKSISNSTQFFVDTSILTFHSPDVEFGDIVDMEGYNYNISIGKIAEFQSSHGEIDITSSAPAMSSESDITNGFVRTENKIKLSYDSNFSDAILGLYNTPAYMDTPVYKDSEGNFSSLDSPAYRFYILPWHRSGSLNNDIPRPSDKGSQTAMLKKKILSNIRFSGKNANLVKPAVYEVYDLQIFDPNKGDSMKIKTLNNKLYDTLNYYGNVDTLLSPEETFNVVRGFQDYYALVATEDNFVGSNTGKYIPAACPTPKDTTGVEIRNPQIRMKYKSTKHLVLNLSAQSKVYTLPSLHNQFEIKNDSDVMESWPFWYKKDEENIIAGWGAIKQHFEKNGRPDGSSFENVRQLRAIVDQGTLDINNKDQFIYPWTLYKHIPNVSDSLQVNDYVLVKVNINNQLRMYLYTAVNTANDQTTWDYVELKAEDLGNLLCGYINGYSTSGADKIKYHYQEYEVQNQGTALGQIQEVVNSGKDTIYGMALRTSPYTTDVEIYYPSPVIQENVSITSGHNNNPFMFMGEITRKEEDIVAPFGGNSEEAIQNNTWVPAGETTKLTEMKDAEVIYSYGDTWCQRYDCLKTYPYTYEDENQIVEIASFICESRINLDGRYDRNRGNLSNININPDNFNKINDVYKQKDIFFNYRIFNDDYYKESSFPQQIIWSMEKQNGSDVDNWCRIPEASTLLLDGYYGGIKAISGVDELIVFQDNAISKIFFNSRVQVPTSDGVPIEIKNSFKVDGYKIIKSQIGVQDNRHVILVNNNILFFDSYRGNLYYYEKGEAVDIGQITSMSTWFKQKKNVGKWIPYLKDGYKNGIQLFREGNNIYISEGLEYDYNYRALCLNTTINKFVGFFDYGGLCALESINGKTLSLKQESGNITLWENFNGPYNYFYGEYKPFYISTIQNDQITTNKIFNTIEYQADCYDSNVLLHNQTFTKIQVDNEYQDSGLVDNKAIKKFRIWRAQLPRDKKDHTKKGYRNRISNPWARVKLVYDNKDSVKMIIDKLDIKYTI